MTDLLATNPASWPEELLGVLDKVPTCEVATMSARGTPITFPINPYMGEDGKTIDVQTGLTYPAKAERARRNSKVALLMWNWEGSGVEKPPTILITGHAVVQDRDIQANTDRYLKASMSKYPQLYAAMKPEMVQQMDWYWARIWIKVVPTKIWWWPEGDMDHEAKVWEAPDGIAIPESDPAPPGHRPPAWKPAGRWQTEAAYSIKQLGNPVLTAVGSGGFPVAFPTRSVKSVADGFDLTFPGAVANVWDGTACLTFHAPIVVQGMWVAGDNRTFVGTVNPTSDGASHFKVERVLPSQSGTLSKYRIKYRMMFNQRKLGPRLKSECARRSQPVPTIHMPGA